MNRRWLIIGVLALLVAGATYLFFSRLEQKATVVVATRDLPAGTRLQAPDLETKVIHASGTQTGVYSDTETLLGRKLRVARLQGDQLTRAAFAAQPSQAEILAPTERAIAVHVNDSQGLMGLLQPDDHVSVIMVDSHNDQARHILQGLRVLKISHTFLYQEPADAAPPTGSAISLGGDDAGAASAAPALNKREDEGTVLLAVPTNVTLDTELQLPDAAGEVFTATAQISAPEALALLDQLGGLHLLLEPREKQPAAKTTGVDLAWLAPEPEPVVTTTVALSTTPIITLTAPVDTEPLTTTAALTTTEPLTGTEGGE
jgi:Flp pilus assembly protein CpaB